jgi:hypothetical protein
MKITSIEPTPSPHSMKINLDEKLPENETRNYKQSDDLTSAPTYIQQLFSINGVKGIYQVIDFIALERNPKVAWEVILPSVRNTLGTIEQIEDSSSEPKPESITDSTFGEVKVLIQMFRNIPMQVKLDDSEEEKRYGLPDRFMNAALEASATSPNFVMERKWVEQRPRYGSLDEVGTDIVDELSASYDEKRLHELVEHALQQNNDTETVPKEASTISLAEFDNPDWKVRYAALDRLDPTFQSLPILEKALSDEKASIRRLATAYLGMIEEPEVLPYLYKALKDQAVTVRRTAGDCISDLGFKEAIPEMIQSLKDPNRLVRWRAAMYLYEIGDETAIEALKEAVNDPEFEVRMQVKMALQRIEGGEEALGSVWHQMTQATKRR